MHEFKYKDNYLCCEDVKLQDLAKNVKTPFYVYSANTILDHFLKIKNAFASVKPLICYSVKANSNLSILKLLVDNGAGLDIVSGGELYRAQKVKCPPKRIVYASVGKTTEEIKYAIDYGILMFNVESEPELKRIDAVARLDRVKAQVCLRVNPDVTPNTHKYITTGKKETKFGMDMTEVEKIIINQKAYPNLQIVGLHMHIGSQITQSEPFITALTKIKEFIKLMKVKGAKFKYLNIGGGLGIIYDKEQPQTADSFAEKVLPLLKEINLKIVLEPGRFIVGNAGILVTRVLYIKDTPVKRFIIVDAGMNDLIRPALYEAYHEIVPLIKTQNSKLKTQKLADVVGPICESGDFLGKDRRIDVNEGDYLAVLSCGAYGFSMSSNYNSRCRASEIMIDADMVSIIRSRERYEDLIAKERRVNFKMKKV